MFIIKHELLNQYWGGQEWVPLSEAVVFYNDKEAISRYISIASVCIPEYIEVPCVDEYKSIAQVKDRIWQIFLAVFGEDVTHAMNDNNIDCINIRGFSVFFNEDTRVLTERLYDGKIRPVLVPGYQLVYTKSYGGSYDSPPDADYADIGKPYEILDNAIIELVKLVAENAVQNFLESEALREEDFGGNNHYRWDEFYMNAFVEGAWIIQTEEDLAGFRASAKDVCENYPGKPGVWTEIPYELPECPTCP